MTKRTCRFFLQGNCAKGDQCEFEHKYPPGAGSRSPDDSAQPSKQSWYKQRARQPLARQQEQDDSIEEDKEQDDRQQDEDFVADDNAEEDDEEPIVVKPEVRQRSLVHNPNKGKNLRNMLNEIKKKQEDEKSAQPRAPEQESEEVSDNNSDTFGEVKGQRILRKRTRKTQGLLNESSGQSQHRITHIDEESSQMSSQSDEEEDKLEGLESSTMKLPTKIITASSKDSFLNLQKVIRD